MENATKLPARTDRGTIRRLITEACRANSCPEIAQRIVVKWNARYTNCLGKAFYRGPFDMTVQFSIPLWPRADVKERTDTIIHEACHIIARYKYQHIGGRSRIKPHGREWKLAMAYAGTEPTRCHKVSNEGLKRKTKKFKHACGCMTHEVGAVRHKRILAGTIYTCRHCRQPLTIWLGN